MASYLILFELPLPSRGVDYGDLGIEYLHEKKHKTAKRNYKIYLKSIAPTFMALLLNRCGISHMGRRLNIYFFDENNAYFILG